MGHIRFASQHAAAPHPHRVFARCCRPSISAGRPPRHSPCAYRHSEGFHLVHTDELRNLQRGESGPRTVEAYLVEHIATDFARHGIEGQMAVTCT